MSFERVCALSALAVESAALAEVGGIKVTIARDEDGEVHAVAHECSHGRVSLAEGEVEGCVIECWLHGSRFDLTTGKPLTPPAVVPIAVYPVQIIDEDVYVSVTETVPAES